MNAAWRSVIMTMDEIEQSGFRDRLNRRAKAKRNGKDMPLKAPVPAAEGSQNRYATPFGKTKTELKKSLF